MSILALAGDHLGAIGLAPGILSSMTKGIDTADIFSIALRMVLIGLFAAGVRKVFIQARVTMSEYLFPTAFVAAEDPAFAWVMAYLAQDQSLQNRLRSFRLTTADSRESKRHDAKRNSSYYKKEKLLVMGKTEASFILGSVIGQMVPVNERYVKIVHDGNTLWIKRADQGFALSPGQKDVDHICITGLAYQPDSIKQFLIAAHAAYFKKADKEILIFHPSPQTGAWYDPISRPSRRWNSVLLPASIKDDLLKDVAAFLSDEEQEWYAERGIPHRRGYLLHGRPGAGKTTLGEDSDPGYGISVDPTSATAIASALKLDIYVINPAARGMDDGKLNKAFRSCPPGNMILIEDIDCVMPKKRRGDTADDDEEDGENTAEADPGKFGFAKSTVTLSGLLNAIDGVSSQEDCVLFASTNHPNRLDEALSRPGRFDVHAAFYDATREQALALFKHFYPTSKLDIEVPTVLESGKASAESSEKADSSNVIDSRSEAIMTDLADQFANAIFSTDPLPDGADVAVSMAALQGYLLKHKKQPRSAAAQAREWVKGELETVQRERVQKRLEKMNLAVAEKEAKLKKDELADQTAQAPLTPTSVTS